MNTTLLGGMLALVCLLHALAVDARPARVAVLAPVRVGIEDDRAAEVVERIASQLEEAYVIRIVRGQELAGRLPVDGVDEGCAFDSACSGELLERVLADSILFLALVHMGDQIKIEGTLVDSKGPDPRPVVLVDAELGQGEALIPLLEGYPRRPAPPPAEEPQPATPPSPPPPPEQVLSSPPAVPSAAESGVRTEYAAAAVWTTTALSVAAGGVAVYFAMRAKSDHDRLEELDCATFPCPREDIDSLERNARVADILGGSSLALGLTAVAIYFVSRSEVPVAVTASSSSMEMSWTGRF